jgi:hypothetical protein
MQSPDQFLNGQIVDIRGVGTPDEDKMAKARSRT